MAGSTDIAMQTLDPTARRMLAPSAPTPVLHGLEDMALDTETQVTSLLRPFAQHVRSMQEAIGELSEHLGRVDARMDMQEKRLADTSVWGQQLKSDIDPMKAHLVAVQNGLALVSRERGSLEQDHEETKAAVRALGQRADELAGVGPRLREDLDSARGGLEQLAAEVQDLRNFTANNEPSLQKHGRELGELLVQQQRNARDLEQKGKVLDEMIHSDKDFKRAYAKQVDEDQRVLHAFSTRLQQLQALLENTDGRVDTHAQELKGNVAETKVLRSSNEKLDSELVTLLSRTDRMKKELQSLAEKFAPLDKGLNQLLETANRPVKSSSMHKKRNLSEFLEDLENTVVQNTERIQDLNLGQAAQDAQAMKSTDGLAKQLQELRDTIGQTRTGLDELYTITGTSRGILDNSMNLHSDAKAELSANAERVSTIRDEVRSLRAELTEATGNIAKLHGSLDLCHDYMSGMRKGFRDAGTRVVGTDDPMLPEPSSKPRSMTPVLPHMRGPKSLTPSTALAASCRESPSTCPSPPPLGSARGDPGPVWSHARGFANSANLGDGRGTRVSSR